MEDKAFEISEYVISRSVCLFRNGHERNMEELVQAALDLRPDGMSRKGFSMALKQCFELCFRVLDAKGWDAGRRDLENVYYLEKIRDILDDAI